MKKLGELGFTIVPSGHSRSAETALLHERKKNPSHATGRVPGVRKPGLPGSRKLSEIGEV